MIIWKVLAYFLYRDAPEAQRHVSDRLLGLGHRATSDSGNTVSLGNRAEMCI